MSVYGVGRLIARRIALSYRLQSKSYQYRLRAGRRGNLVDDIGIPIEYFNNELWEELSREIIASQIEKAGNPGQETLLGEDYFAGAAINYCAESQESYDEEEFIEYIEDKLGDVYYSAINIIVAECSVELAEAWEICTQYFLAGRSFALSLTSYLSTPGRAFASYAAALNNYQINAIANYARRQPVLYARGYAFNSYAASIARSRITASKFLRKNPTGLPRYNNFSNFTNRAYSNLGSGWDSNASADKRSRTTATNFLNRYPGGIPRP